MCVIGENVENLALKSGFETVFDFKLICLTNYAPHNDLPNQVAQLVPFGELLDVKEPSVEVMVEPIS